MSGPRARRARRRAAAAAAVLLLACACGSGGAGDAGPPGSGEPGGQGAGGTAGGTVTVLAAASLTDPLSALARKYEADHPGVDVALSFGSSTTLAQQVAEGAPADVVAFAGTQALRFLPKDAAADGGRATMARNTMEIATPAGQPRPGDGTGRPGPPGPRRGALRLDGAVRSGRRPGAGEGGRHPPRRLARGRRQGHPRQGPARGGRRGSGLPLRRGLRRATRCTA